MWGLLTAGVTLWLGFLWLKQALAGGRYALFAYLPTQQDGDCGREKVDTRRRRGVAVRAGSPGRPSPRGDRRAARAKRTAYNRRRTALRASVREYFYSRDDALRGVVLDKLADAMEDTRPQFVGAEAAYDALLRVTPDWRAYRRALELLYQAEYVPDGREMSRLVQMFTDEAMLIQYVGSDYGSSPRGYRCVGFDRSPRASHERRMKTLFGEDTPLRRRSRSPRATRPRAVTRADGCAASRLGIQVSPADGCALARLG